MRQAARQRGTKMRPRTTGQQSPGLPAEREPRPLPSYEGDVHAEPLPSVVTEEREKIVWFLDACVNRYPRAKPLADDFLRRWDRCAVLEAWLSSDLTLGRALTEAARTALLDAWRVDAMPRVALLDPQSVEGKKLRKRMAALHRAAARLRRLGIAAVEGVEREASR